MPARDLRSELFPAPFRPITATISLLEMVALTDFRAGFASYVTERSLTLIIVSPICAGTASFSRYSLPRISAVMRRISRTDTPISFKPRARAKWTIGGAMGEFISICSGVPTLATPAPLM